MHELHALKDYLTAGSRACLVTLIRVDGSSPRPIGSQMVVSDTGDHEGYLTGGCAEAAIAGEALAGMTAGRNFGVRFGKGSPYMDIVLPCGSGIDIWFDTHPTLKVVNTLIEHQLARKRVALLTQLRPTGSISTVETELHEPSGNAFLRTYFPTRRLYIFGGGPVTHSLASLAQAAGYEVEVFTPDTRTLEYLTDQAVAVRRLIGTEQIIALPTDPWTAVVLLFHEHDRETALFERFLPSDVGYIGAIGSRVTHGNRLETLRGIDLSQTSRIHGPIGLDIAAKSSNEIAISILAEMTLSFRKAQPDNQLLCSTDAFPQTVPRLDRQGAPAIPSL